MDYDRSQFEVGSLSLFLRFNRIRRPRADRHHELPAAQVAYVTHPGSEHRAVLSIFSV